MCACAGSSTERANRLSSCVPRKCPARKRYVFEVFRRSGPDGSRPGRIGFMSTQRRENRWQRLSTTAYAGASESIFPAPIMRQVRAGANGGTAPPQFSVRLATNSLQLDCRFLPFDWLVQLFQAVQLVCPARPFRQDIRLGVSPLRAVRRTATGTLATHGLSLPHIPFPSGLARLPLTLPQIPTGRRRRAERYDGKRDLHLQHAA
jgi:hypothetical protein